MEARLFGLSARDTALIRLVAYGKDEDEAALMVGLSASRGRQRVAEILHELNIRGGKQGRMRRLTAMCALGDSGVAQPGRAVEALLEEAVTAADAYADMAERRVAGRALLREAS